MATPKGNTSSSGSVKEEVIVLVRWTGTTAGRVVKDELSAISAVNRGVGDVASGQIPRGLSPSCSSERNELSSSFSTKEQRRTQQMGAPPESSESATSKDRRTSRGETAGGVSLILPILVIVEDHGPLMAIAAARGMRTELDREERGEEIDISEVGFVDNDVVALWWKSSEPSAKIMRVWAVRDGDRARLYAFNHGVWNLSLAVTERGRKRALREIRKLLHRGQSAPWPEGYTLVADGVYEYLTDFRRETGTLPSPTTWQHVWKGAVDSGGRRLTACFECSACGVSRRVSAKHLSDIIRWQRQGRASCPLLVGAMCDRVRGEYIFEVDEGAEDDGSSDRRNDLGDSGSERRESPGYSRSEGVGGFSQEAKQFYKAQSKHLQLPCYQGESSEVDLFA